MINLLDALRDRITHVYFHHPPNEGRDDLVDQQLVYGPSIPQVKWRHIAII